MVSTSCQGRRWTATQFFWLYSGRINPCVKCFWALMNSSRAIGRTVVSPKWWFCCCDRWKRAVRWGLSSSPSPGAGSSAPSCAGIWESCKEMAEGTVGWRMCPLQPSAPGCYLLPGEKRRKPCSSNSVKTKIWSQIWMTERTLEKVEKIIHKCSLKEPERK